MVSAAAESRERESLLERGEEDWGDGAQASAVGGRLAATAAERGGEEREPRRLLREREREREREQRKLQQLSQRERERERERKKKNEENAVHLEEEVW